MFFRLLLVFIVIYLIVKLIQSYGNSRSRKQNSSSFRKTGNFNKQQRKEGETVVEINQNKNKKKIPKNEGEYVDYEEL